MAPLQPAARNLAGRKGRKKIDKDKKILLKTENNLEIRDALEELFEP